MRPNSAVPRRLAMLVSYSALASGVCRISSIHTKATTNTSIDARQLHLSRLFSQLKTQRHRNKARLNRRRGAHWRQRERSSSYERCRSRHLSKQRATRMARWPAESKALLEPNRRAARSDAPGAPPARARARTRQSCHAAAARAHNSRPNRFFSRAAPTAARRPP